MNKQFLFLILISFLISCQEQTGEYVCPPCDLPCDTLTFQKPGICPHCQMTLIKKSELFDESTLVLNDIQISTGSGVFLIEGPEGKKEKTIKVFYHKPERFNTETKILMVIPGAGRNGDSYRDAWVAEAEQNNLLILSPQYEEENYPFEDYHLCGFVKEINIQEAIKFLENSNVAQLDEEQLNFKVNNNVNDFLFHDFDRIFDLVVNSIAGTQTNYDLFGHSAGGQILHRMALFQHQSKADKIIASNAGFYTLPDIETELPFGIKNTHIANEHLSNAFKKELILLIGALDNESETGGTLLRSKTVDQQGIHRLARAKYFYEFSKKLADDLEYEFNWEIQIVPNVGHNHELMGEY